MPHRCGPIEIWTHTISKCRFCGHRWVAVHPVAIIAVECSRCGKETGIAIAKAGARRLRKFI